MIDADDLTVVVPTRSRPDILEQTLDALERQSVTGFDIVVVVDGEDQLVPQRPGVRTLVQPHAGPGAARNRGAAATDRRLVLFLGDDMIPTSPVVEGHLRGHARHPDPSSAVLGKVDWHPAVERNLVVRWLDRSRSQFDFPGDGEEEAGWARFYSCNVSVDRRWFLDAGGFDASFPFDYEDLDCAVRLAQRGLRLWYEPGAVVHHLHPQSWDGLLQRYRTKAEGERRFCEKHPSFAPFFRARIEDAATAPPVPDALASAADRLAGRALPGAARAAAVVDRWFHQRVGVPFLAAWDAADDTDAGWTGPVPGPTRSAAVLAALASPALQPGDRVVVAGGGPPSVLRRLDLLGAKLVDGLPAGVVVVPDVDAVDDAAFGTLEAGARQVVAGASRPSADRLLERARRAGIRRWHEGSDGVAVRYAGERGARWPDLAPRHPSPPAVSAR